MRYSQKLKAAAREFNRDLIPFLKFVIPLFAICVAGGITATAAAEAGYWLVAVLVIPLTIYVGVVVALAGLKE